MFGFIRKLRSNQPINSMNSNANALQRLAEERAKSIRKTPDVDRQIEQMLRRNDRLLK